MKAVILLLGTLFLPLTDLAFAQKTARSGVQTPQSAEVVGRTELDFLLYLPTDYDQQASHPLLLFLHGAGERGDHELEKVKVHGPPKLIAGGEDFPFIVVSPQCKAGGWWQPAELSDLIDHLQSNYKVDPQRIYVTGLSMGGFGTWALALYEPERFAAIAPICGGGNAIAARYSKPIRSPTWVFHGAKDNVVPLSESQEMVSVLKRNGTNVKFTIYPDAEHDSWTETYNNQELYKWLLSHAKTNKEQD